MGIGIGHPVRDGHRSRLVTVHERAGEYSIELDVSEFQQDQLEVAVSGQRVTVRADQVETKGESMTFRLHERLEESFRLPDDADPTRVRAVYRHGTLELSTRRRPVVKYVVPIEPDYLLDPGPQGC